MVLYTGTFEAYQGLDLLFEAMAIVHDACPDARLVLAGGKPDQVDRARDRARVAGIGAVTIFAGERPADEIPAYLLAADVLVSPRSRGTNTPLKIYQYLRSGKPIVATRLLTHTQVLSDDTAVLTGATSAEFAGGILEALDRSGPGGGDWQAGAASGRHEVQLRGLPRADTSGLRALQGFKGTVQRFTATGHGDPFPARDPCSTSADTTPRREGIRPDRGA